jgi:hypothetical protein
MLQYFFLIITENLNFHQEVRDDAIRYYKVYFIGNSLVLNHSNH